MDKTDIGRLCWIAKCKTRVMPTGSKLKASLEDLEGQRQGQDSSVTQNSGLDRGKREAAKNRPIVGKLKTLDPKAIAKGLKE